MENVLRSGDGDVDEFGCPVDHSKFKRQNLGSRVCPICDARLPTLEFQRRPVLPIRGSTPEIIDLTTSPERKSTKGYAAVRPAQLLVSGHKNAARTSTTNDTTTNTPRSGTPSLSFVEAAEASLRERDRSARHLRTADTSPRLSIAITTTLYIGQYTTTDVEDDMGFLKFSVIGMKAKYHPVPFVPTEVYDSIDAFSKALLQRSTNDPVILSKDWRLIHSVSQGPNPNITQLSQPPCGPLTTQEIVDFVFGRPIVDQCTLVLFRGHESMSAAGSKGRKVKVKKEEDSAEGNSTLHNKRPRNKSLTSLVEESTLKQEAVVKQEIVVKEPEDMKPDVKALSSQVQGQTAITEEVVVGIKDEQDGTCQSQESSIIKIDRSDARQSRTQTQVPFQTVTRNIKRKHSSSE